MTAPTFSDVVEDKVDSVSENAALQGWTVQVEAVGVVLRGVVVENGQITGNCKRKRPVYSESDRIFDRFFKKNGVIAGELTVASEATGAAAFERTSLLVMLQQLRSSALRLLHVDENSRETANPAVLVVRSRRAPRLGAAQQTQHG